MSRDGPKALESIVHLLVSFLDHPRNHLHIFSPHDCAQGKPEVLTVKSLGDFDRAAATAIHLMGASTFPSHERLSDTAPSQALRAKE